MTPFAYGLDSTGVELTFSLDAQGNLYEDGCPSDVFEGYRFVNEDEALYHLQASEYYFNVEIIPQ